MEDRFVRGYAAAILAMIVLGVAFVTVLNVIQELESPRAATLSTLRKIHRKDQEAARDQ